MGEWHLSPRIEIDRYILNIGVICYLTDSLYFSYISTPNGLHSTSTTETETEEIETSQSNFVFEEFFIFKSLKPTQSSLLSL